MVLSVNWGNVGLVLGIVAGLALFFSVLILVVTKFFNIKEDEKVLEILSRLAGANCGGCGHVGCEDYAKCIAKGEGSLADCKVTSDANMQEIAKLSGLPYAKEGRTVAVIKCSGGEQAADKFSYIGNVGCLNQKVVSGGKKLCPNACLGGASCNIVCHMNAIKMINGVAYIDKAMCTSCGTCMRQCPQACIERIPIDARVYVACSATCNAKTVSKVCKAGCIGCRLCVKFCPNHAISLQHDRLPHIDYAKCKGCKTCLAKCPRKIIKEH